MMTKTTLTTSQSTGSNTGIIALNKKHQATVNKAVNWLLKHNAFNNTRDLVYDNLDENECEYDSKELRQIDRKCESSFNKYLEYTSELPSREVKQIEKSELY